MKHKKYTLIYLWLFFFCMISCYESKDPLGTVKLGEMPKDTFIRHLKDMELLTEKDMQSDSTESLDLIGIINRYTYILSQDTVNISFSMRFNKSEYDFGKIQAFELDPKNSSEQVKKAVIAKYSEWYGKPDSLISPWNEGDSEILYDLKWKNESIIVNLDHTIYGDFISYNLHYMPADFKERNKRIKDSIELNQSIKKLAKIANPNCRWENISATQKKFKFDISISRSEKYDLRKITAIRYDLVIQDLFNNELFRNVDLTMELNSPLGPQHLASYYPDDVFWSDTNNDMNYHVSYNIYNPNFAAIERARKYAEKNSIVSLGLITSIVMDDGSVISKQ
ncbi:hypothetical protein H4O18_05110 [Arenibacter sp. BSSL-BM3]|uniref:Lipoprotein n=1 Tax=Arenibacter arenosicollis TaxID=2762274 RepID=A0ABR7QJL0_9FLAO|nr:hypothetical protein [Arenibacter arenosicollis]MBC8767365.1 hypothetical protein [Arenibacter arenosicollis]